jgi:hypothetical protein
MKRKDSIGRGQLLQKSLKRRPGQCIGEKGWEGSKEPTYGSDEKAAASPLGFSALATAAAALSAGGRGEHKRRVFEAIHSSLGMSVGFYFVRYQDASCSSVPQIQPRIA